MYLLIRIVHSPTKSQHLHLHWPLSLSFSRTLFLQWSSLCPHDRFSLSLLIIAISRQTCSIITHLRKTKLALSPPSSHHKIYTLS